MKKTLFSLAFVGITSLSYLCLTFPEKEPADPSPIPSDSPLQWNKLTSGGNSFTVEVARTDHQRQQGLMNREKLPDDHGMLFVFDQPDMLCFWMKNTLLPLSVAFLEDDGTILHIADMMPHSLLPHCTPEPVRLALEMPQGWFTEHGIIAGSHVQL